MHYYNCDDSKHYCFNNLFYFADCLLPKKPGPCKAYFPRYYYDSKKKSCQKFIYGGCQGNANNFKSLEECERKCNTEPEGKVLIVDKCKEIARKIRMSFAARKQFRLMCCCRKTNILCLKKVDVTFG
jgi:hypothetical protein